MYLFFEINFKLFVHDCCKHSVKNRLRLLLYLPSANIDDKYVFYQTKQNLTRYKHFFLFI